MIGRRVRGRPDIACAARVLACALAACAIGVPAVPGRAAEGAPFRRGAAMHTLLNWGTLKPGDAAHYVATPFAIRHQEPDALFRNVKRAGFDFIRLTVDPGPYLQLTGAPRAALDETLLAAVARMRALGLKVIVDLHPVEQVPAYDRDVLAASPESAGFAAYRGLVGRMARLLGGLESPDVALELMNEPPGGYDPRSAARWQTMLESLHGAARAEAPRLLLILSGAESGDIPGLEQLDTAPFKGSNVAYTFHYYEPHDFTHQGVPEASGPARYRRYIAGLPYPSALAADGAALVDRNLTADRRLDVLARWRLGTEARARVAAYRSGGFDRTRIARDFDVVARWAAAHGVPPTRILLGEFGVARHFPDYDGADAASAASWLHDVRTEAERRGYGWSVWTLSGGPMQLATADGAATLDAAVLEALGLRDAAGAP